MYNNLPITILEEVAPATATFEVEISGAGVIVAAKAQEMALGKCAQ